MRSRNTSGSAARCSRMAALLARSICCSTPRLPPRSQVPIGSLFPHPRTRALAFAQLRLSASGSLGEGREWVGSGQPSRREVSPRPVIDLPLQDRLDANAVGSTRTRRSCLITVVVSLTTALSDFAARLVLGHCVACPPGAGEAPKPRLTRAWHIACRGSVCGCGPMRAASRVPSSACGTRQR